MLPRVRRLAMLARRKVAVTLTVAALATFVWLFDRSPADRGPARDVGRRTDVPAEADAPQVALSDVPAVEASRDPVVETEPSELDLKIEALEAKYAKGLRSVSSVETATIEGSVSLLDGTPLRNQPIQATASIRGLSPRQDATTDEHGRFEVGPMVPGPYMVAAGRLRPHPGQAQETRAPGPPVDLRVDAILARVHVPIDLAEEFDGSFTIDGESMDMTGLLVLASFGEGQPKSLMTRPPNPDEEGVVSVVVPSGPGQRISLRIDRDLTLVGTLEPGLPSGAYDVVLAEEPFDLGTVHVVAEAASEAVALSVALQGAGDGATAFTAPIDLVAGETSVLPEARHVGIVPGRYRVLARAHRTDDADLYALVEARPEFVDVRAGETVRVAVAASRGGRIAVLPRAESDRSMPRTRLELYDVEDEQWIGLELTFRTTHDSGRGVQRSSLSTKVHAAKPVAPGPYRLRLFAEGWETVEGTVTVREGETAVWEPELVRR